MISTRKLSITSVDLQSLNQNQKADLKSSSFSPNIDDLNQAMLLIIRHLATNPRRLTLDQWSKEAQSILHQLEK